MEIIDQTIDIDLPLQTVYNQWTRFEDFPLFMQGVTGVKQLDCQRLEWQVRLAGWEKTWQAEIYEQEPDECIALRSTNGVKVSGRVDFGPLGANCTRLFLHLNYEPEGLLEKTAAAVGLVKTKVLGDLRRFKEFIEGAVVLPAGWRGSIGEDGVHREEMAAPPPVPEARCHANSRRLRERTSPLQCLHSACAE
jgi:uncharacterized membrane protein